MNSSRSTTKSAGPISSSSGMKTNGQGTYDGGRFLDFKVDTGNQTVLNFNRAYNPPCAFTAFATCPLPPAQNRFPFRLEAGEKKYKGHD